MFIQRFFSSNRMNGFNCKNTSNLLMLLIVFIACSSFFLDKSKTVKNQKEIGDFPKFKFTDKEVNFLIIGDWGAGGSIQRNVAKGMESIFKTDNIQFIISTGDNFYPSGVTSTTDNQWKTKFHSVYKGDLQTLDWYPVLGNHDYKLNPEAQIEYSSVFHHWKMPSNYYKYSKTKDENSIDFFAIDTQLLISGTKDQKKAQLDWLDKELSQSTAKWKVCIGHHMIRSHGVYGDQSFMLKTVKPTLDKYNVKMYLSGHDHDLQLIKSSEDSFYQLISGAGGGARDTGYGKNTLFAHTNGGFVSCSISNKNIRCKFYNQYGSIVFSQILE